MLAFIPLYPKIPLFSPIEQYIVRVRVEDIFVLAAGLIWFSQVIRGKIRWKSSLLYTMTSYFLMAALSMYSAIFILHSIPLQPLHVGKSLLHFFRYIEYFTLFLIVFSSINTRKQLLILFGVLSATIVALATYGYGQRYYYWPVYSTMNREFSKGVRLYLTEHARVQSTFAGHYDLGAYLVIVLPLLLALGFTAKHPYKGILFSIQWAGLWLLIVSASRTSFVAYVLGISLVVSLFALQKTTWPQKIFWGASRYAVIMVCVLLTLISFGDDMSDRLLQVIEGSPKLAAISEVATNSIEYIQQAETQIALLNTVLQMPAASVPEGAFSTEEARIILDSDTRPSPEKPADVYVDVPDFVEVEIASESAEGTVMVSTVLASRERVFSECSKERGLSLCIRLESLWPQAIAGFMRNPLFGTGYATLNKTVDDQFTEADSTDNNFLRSLGETGILGFLTFYGSIALALWYASRRLRSNDTLLKAVAIGYIGGTVGLLLNAVYIDVFAASKVAFIFWGMTGMILAIEQLDVSTVAEISTTKLTTKKNRKQRVRKKKK